MSCCITDSHLDNNPFEFENEFKDIDDEPIKALFDFAELLINGEVDLKVKDFLGNLLTQKNVDI